MRHFPKYRELPTKEDDEPIVGEYWKVAVQEERWRFWKRVGLYGSRVEYFDRI